MKQRADLSVIIVNFNTRELLDICLQSLFGSLRVGSRIEVIVVDNNSDDQSVAMLRKKYPHITVIANSANLGFARANNLGLRKSTGKYVLLLNSDTEVPPGALETMIHFMDNHPEAGAATCKLTLPNGQIDPACHRGFPTPWASLTYLLKLERVFPESRVFGQYHQGYKKMDETHEVDCISGAFFLLRRETMEDVGELDEDYFMYGEDIDWAFRIRSKGWRILYYPYVSVLHKKKQSGRSNTDINRRISTEIYFHTYNWLFYKKNYAKKYGVLLTGLVNLFYTVRIYLLKHFSI